MQRDRRSAAGYCSAQSEPFCHSRCCRPVLSRRRFSVVAICYGLRTLRELGRSYLTIGKDLTRVMNRLKAVYRSWGDSLCRYRGLYCARSSGMAEQDPTSRRAASSRSDSISRWTGLQPLRRASATRVAWRRVASMPSPRNCCDRFPVSDRFEPRWLIGADPDPASISHQATTLDL